MTCHYTNTDWLDVLYGCVRKTKGGVADAARFLTERRGRSIHPESLRAKLRGLEGESLSVEMAELLTEWMEEKACSVGFAKDWMQVFVANNGLHVDYVPPAPANGWQDEAAALQTKFMDITQMLGQIAGVTAETLADGVITQAEADKLTPLLRDARVILHRMERNALRAARGEP